MNKELLPLLKDETKKLEVQIIIQEAMIKVVNNMDVKGSEAAQVAQNKAFLESSLDLNKLTVAELKKLIKGEENNG